MNDLGLGAQSYMFEPTWDELHEHPDDQEDINLPAV